MSLLTDRDLLHIEPSVFPDAMGASTILVETDSAALSGTTLTFPGPMLTGVSTHHAVVVRDEGLEIRDPISSSQMQVRRPHPGEDCPLAVPESGTGLKASVVTFGRHLDLVEQWACDMLEVAVGGDGDDGRPTIVEEGGLKRLVALETLARVYSAASAIDPDDASLEIRAALYREHADRARRLVSVRIDLDGDGVADATRRLDFARMKRS
jgi:hypothetical protein